MGGLEEGKNCRFFFFHRERMPGREADALVWRVFERFKPPDKKYYYGRCRGCGHEFPGVLGM
jgi:hypothetical protein